MCNFRESESELDCTHCVEFTSYQATYEDELEPLEYGTCSNIEVGLVGERTICDKFSRD